MDILNKQFESWNKKSKNILLLNRIYNNIISVNIDNIELKIDCNEYLEKKKINLIFKESEDLSWLSNINFYCLTKKPTIKKLLKKIENEYIKHDIVNNKSNINLNRNFDIDNLRLKKKLLENMKIKNNDSTLTDNNEKSLYNIDTVNELLVNQYINVYKKYGDKIKIDPIDGYVDKLKIKFYNFNNKNLMNELKLLNKTNNINYVEISITFNNKLFPIYPPIIKYTKPRLKSNKFIYQLSSLKMINPDYWSPTRSLEFIIDKLYKILDKHCSIDIELINNKNLEYNKLERNFTELFSLYDESVFNNKINIDNENYIRIYSKNNKGNSKANNSKYWVSGTGYGHRNLKSWDIDNYIKIQKENDNRKYSILSIILQNLQENNNNNIINIIKDCLLIDYIKSLLNGLTLIDINKNLNLYEIIFQLLSTLICNKKCYVEIVKMIYSNNDSLFLKINDIYKRVLVYNKLNKNDNSYDFIIKFFDNFTNKKNNIEFEYIIKLKKKIIEEINSLNFNKISDFLRTKSKNNNKIKKSIEFNKDEYLRIKYLNELSLLSFETYPISKLNTWSYKKNLKNTDFTNKKLLKSINNEYVTLMDPIVNYDSSIFFRIDDECIVCMQALITGPKDTPYDSGCLIFDILIPNNYPFAPPKVLLKNNGGMRMNPNLYNNGKVCLSLLGTWNTGGKDEGWIPKLSTIKQVGISIQSLILIEQPFFNEPSYERDINTSRGNLKSLDYNMNIRYYTMKELIYETFKKHNKTAFSNVITKHFILKKEYILNNCQEWVNEAIEYDKKYKKKVSNRYITCNEKIKDLYLKYEAGLV